MKRSFFILSGIFLLSGLFGTNASAQGDVLDGIYVKEHVPARKPIPYYHLREADVMWSKRIWRMIDLKEKINHPLYFPTKPYKEQPFNDRFSLICLLLYGVEKEGLVVYDPDIDDQFTVPITPGDLEVRMGGGVDTVEVEDPETFVITMKIVPKERRVEEVTRLMMKEEWYFDKQRSKMEVRIIGLCPIRTYYRPDDYDKENLEMKKVMWVYYPSVRHIFANNEVFNPYNDTERRTFEDIFFMRKFSSFIYQETNVYNNRRIEQYRKGLDALLESEKIKDFMFKVEHDLWEF
ncbi:MAG: gliding motility protein GldN [Bacteroidota bacterium]